MDANKRFRKKFAFFPLSFERQLLVGCSSACVVFIAPGDVLIGVSKLENMAGYRDATSKLAMYISLVPVRARCVLRICARSRSCMLLFRWVEARFNRMHGTYIIVAKNQRPFSSHVHSVTIRSPGVLGLSPTFARDFDLNPL